MKVSGALCTLRRWWIRYERPCRCKIRPRMGLIVHQFLHTSKMFPRVRFFGDPAKMAKWIEYKHKYRLKVELRLRALENWTEPTFCHSKNVLAFSKSMLFSWNYTSEVLNLLLFMLSSGGQSLLTGKRPKIVEKRQVNVAFLSLWGLYIDLTSFNEWIENMIKKCEIGSHFQNLIITYLLNPKIN